ncbi:hypothetical protein Aperf_G00000129187 [Anoplocephala perfoliata]
MFSVEDSELSYKLLYLVQENTLSYHRYPSEDCSSYSEVWVNLVLRSEDVTKVALVSSDLVIEFNDEQIHRPPNKRFSLSESYQFNTQNPEDPQQQYSENTPQQVQNILPTQVPDNVHHSSESSSVVVAPVSSSLSPRSSAVYGSVYLTEQSSQSLNTYSEANKLTEQSFYSLGASADNSGQGVAGYVHQADLQDTASTGPGFNTPGYHTSVTSSVVQNTTQTSGASSSSTDLKKLQLIQLQLLLLLHAQCCHQGQTHATPCSTPHCLTMQNVLQHMKNCTEGMNCRQPYCVSSRKIISHWKNCSSPECPVCGPLKRKRQWRAMAQLPPSQDLPTSSQPVGMNTIPPNQVQAAIHFPVQQNVGRPVTALTALATTSNAQVRSSFPYTQPVSITQRADEDIESMDWHFGINRAQMVDKIVKYILPHPNPSACSDPRMMALIEGAKKVENAAYNTTRDKHEYLQILSERRYKIYRELEEISRRRRSAISISENKPSCPPSDSAASATIAPNVSTNSADPGFAPNLGFESSSVASSNMDLKQDQKCFGGFEREEDIKLFLSGSTESKSSVLETEKSKAENSLQSVGLPSTSSPLNAAASPGSSKTDESKEAKELI